RVADVHLGVAVPGGHERELRSVRGPGRQIVEGAAPRDVFSGAAVRVDDEQVLRPTLVAGQGQLRHSAGDVQSGGKQNRGEKEDNANEGGSYRPGEGLAGPAAPPVNQLSLDPHGYPPDANSHVEPGAGWSIGRG